MGVTYDGQTIRFHIDGVEDSYRPSPALVFGIVDEPLTVGADLPGVAEFFDGLIDDVRVYDRALPAGQVRVLMEGGAPGHPG